MGQTISGIMASSNGGVLERLKLFTDGLNSEQLAELAIYMDAIRVNEGHLPVTKNTADALKIVYQHMRDALNGNNGSTAQSAAYNGNGFSFDSVFDIVSDRESLKKLFGNNGNGAFKAENAGESEDGHIQKTAPGYDDTIAEKVAILYAIKNEIPLKDKEIGQILGITPEAVARKKHHLKAKEKLIDGGFRNLSLNEAGDKYLKETQSVYSGLLAEIDAYAKERASKSAAETAVVSDKLRKSDLYKIGVLAALEAGRNTLSDISGILEIGGPYAQNILSDCKKSGLVLGKKDQWTISGEGFLELGKMESKRPDEVKAYRERAKNLRKAAAESCRDTGAPAKYDSKDAPEQSAGEQSHEKPAPELRHVLEKETLKLTYGGMHIDLLFSVKQDSQNRNCTPSSNFNWELLALELVDHGSIKPDDFKNYLEANVRNFDLKKRATAVLKKERGIVEEYEGVLKLSEDGAKLLREAETALFGKPFDELIRQDLSETMFDDGSDIGKIKVPSAGIIFMEIERYKSYLKKSGSLRSASAKLTDLKTADSPLVSCPPSADKPDGQISRPQDISLKGKGGVSHVKEDCSSTHYAIYRDDIPDSRKTLATGEKRTPRGENLLTALEVVELTGKISDAELGSAHLDPKDTRYVLMTYCLTERSEDKVVLTEFGQNVKNNITKFKQRTGSKPPVGLQDSSSQTPSENYSLQTA